MGRDMGVREGEALCVHGHGSYYVASACSPVPATDVGVAGGGSALWGQPGGKEVAEGWPDPSPGWPADPDRVPFSFPDMDATYRPMYSSDMPLDPLEMHMDMEGDYPIDTYSEGLRPPYPTADHMLA